MDDLISRQHAIDALRAMQTYKMFAGDDMLLIDQAEAQTELMMLPSVQPESKRHGCEHCCEDSDGYVLSIEKNGHAYIQNGKLALRANGWWGECAINFCPMCGRKLRGEQE